jgi:hypothetical protein
MGLTLGCVVVPDRALLRYDLVDAPAASRFRPTEGRLRVYRQLFKQLPQSRLIKPEGQVAPDHHVKFADRVGKHGAARQHGALGISGCT